MTSMLGAILMYNFAIFIFLFTSDNFYDGNINSGLLNKAGESVCMSLLHCYLSTLNYGLRFGGGIGELSTTTIEPWNRSNFMIKFFFDITFFLIITTIILNVVFGIIIDSFAELRETAAFKLNDKKDICFMCGLDKYTLDKDTSEGFNYHLEFDHCVWNYVYFIIHLKQKDSSDFNGTESQIYEQLEKEEMGWFPTNKSIRMNQFLAGKKKGAVKDEESELDIMAKHIESFND